MLEDGILAVIPARGGSKRLPRKNVRPLAGKPLIAHSIAAALAVSPPLRKILVSTDDEEIAQVAREAGVDVPFLRPAALSTDDAESIDVIRHVIDWVERTEDWRPRWILLLQPTSPLRTAGDIEAAIAIAERYGADSVIGVTSLGHAHPQKVQRIVGGVLAPYMLEAKNFMRSNELEPAYMINGAIYLTRADLIRQGRLIGDAARPYLMPTDASIDIDTLVEFRLAELLIEKREVGW